MSLERKIMRIITVQGVSVVSRAPSGLPARGREEWACNHDGEGVFSRRTDGTWAQHEGTCDTPQFRTAVQFRAYLRRQGYVKGARTVHTSGWPAAADSTT